MKFSKKINTIFNVLILTTTIGMLFSGCHSKKANKQPETQNPNPKTGSYYTCSMHPKVHKDKPGDCPLCGMKLIKVEKDSKENQPPIDSSLSYLTQPVTQTVVGSFKVITPVKTKTEHTIIADGHIGFDERDLHQVSIRVTGRIEKLYIKYTHQKITKGQPLMVIYSPELASAQRDLLQAKKNKDHSLMTASKERLLRLGMKNSEIEKVLKSNNVSARITIYSPYSGISQPTNIKKTFGNTATSLNIKEGMYVNRGQTVFSIQNTNTTWAILNIFNNDIMYVQPGDSVRLYADTNPEKIIKEKIDFIPPYRTHNEKTIRARVYLNQLPIHWKAGTLIHGRISVKSKNSFWFIPLSAVNKLGMQNVIWIQDKKHKGVFHVQKIKTGLQTRDSIQVLAGINPGDKIVSQAAYMVGSDSFIQ